MTKQKFDVNTLRVASPCSVGWENMSGDERTRFCKLCNLNVYNISELSTKEVQTLIAKTEGGICGRIYKRADGTILTKDCPVGLRAYYKRTARFAGSALGAIIGLFSSGFGQSDLKKSEVSEQSSQVEILRTETKKDAKTLEGRITDSHGAVVPNAEIILKNEHTKMEWKIRTDEDGFYSFSSIPAGNYTFRLEAGYFASYKLTDISINKNESLRIDVRLQINSENVIVGILVEGLSDVEIDLSKIKIQTNITPRKDAPPN